MKCPKCQFENREEAIFCRSCGASLVSDISCPNCEASNPPDSKFCEICGQDLKPPKKSLPLKYSEPQIGDTTNLAARMESKAEPGSILVSEATFKLANDFFHFHPLGKIKVKGKKQPQQAYMLIKESEVETRIKASVARGLTKFVGRKNSMPALKEPYERVLSGAGQVVGVVGEAGVGKSRLLLEFIKQLPQDEYNYLEGNCLLLGSYRPLWG